MDCGEAREAISALLDDEPLGIAREALEAHLAGCAACRRWREEAHEVTRRFRLVPAQPVPSPGEDVLAEVGVSAGRHRLRREVTLTRVALVAVALAQLAWVTLPALVLGTDHDAPIHVSHEMGSFDLALAVGFLVAAWRPARAQGMRALVGAAALLLMLTAIIDLVAGRTTPSDEAPHLLAVAGWLLVRHLASLTPSGADDPAFSLRSLLKWRTRGASSTPGERALTVESGTRELEGYDDLAASGSADVFAHGDEPDHKRALAG